ncbi:MAG: DUF1016 N-terminal domain-containing protein [Candidatus Omnitrophica bacterium]|nr:DUF1016 N-terminal domain-containing protein [Candidatus Omnitrophota bacterium]
MPNAVIVPTRLALPAAYASLKKRVQEVLLGGQQRIDAEKVRTYWTTGRLIHGHILRYQDRADYGEKLVKQLSRDLGVSVRILYQCIQFAKTFKKVNGRSLSALLPWSHYRVLITVKDDEQRHELAARAAKEGWTSDKLMAKIRQEVWPDESPSEDSGAKTTRKTSGSGLTTANLKSLSPKLGKLGTYRLIRPEAVRDEPKLLIDLGFMICRKMRIPPGCKSGDIMELVCLPDGLFKIKRSDRTEADLYTYRAKVERVVDGDTLRVQIDLGFDTWVRQYVRLRAIDTPELETKEGRRAKDFVERALAQAGGIILTSSRSDKYDRYLADVFYGPENKNYLNQILLDQGLAVQMGE